MKDLVFQFSNSGSVSDSLIQWYSHGKWSHIDIEWNGLLIGARLKGGVKIRPQNYIKFTDTLRITKHVDNKQHAEAMTFLKKQVGKPYDWSGIMGFAFDRDWREDDSWFCSELGARVAEIAGVFPGKIDNVSKITPVDLLLALSVV